MYGDEGVTGEELYTKSISCQGVALKINYA